MIEEFQTPENTASFFKVCPFIAFNTFDILNVCWRILSIIFYKSDDELWAKIRCSRGRNDHINCESIEISLQ